MDAKHRRCNSDPTWPKAKTDTSHSHSFLKRTKMGEKPHTTEAHLALKQEILELTNLLQHHFLVRRELEKALTGSKHSCFDSIPKSIRDLIKEIARLEKEVAFLENFLLLMHRKTVPNPTKEVAVDPDFNEVEIEFRQSKDELWKKPNMLSEAMIKSMCFIYSELSDPPVRISDFTATSFIISSLQSNSENEWRIPYENFSSFVSSVERNDEFWVPYSSMKSVFGISKSPRKVGGIQRHLQSFRLLAYQLEMVNPAEMKHEEKLAFWINIHNTLVMHSFLVNGVSRSTAKRASCALKAAYNIGGQYLSVEIIQLSILHCHVPRPKQVINQTLIPSQSSLSRRQWIRPLFSKGKLRTGDARHAYAIHHQEPRLHFALCSGCYSDAAVRVYTPRRVFDELEFAREEYIQANIFVDEKREKILLPKVVDWFAKDLELCNAGLIEMMKHLIPDCWQGKHRVDVDWIPHDFSFRYVFPKEIYSSFLFEE